MKQAGNKSVANVFDEEDNFTFSPQVYTSRGTSLSGLFGKHNQEITLSRPDALDPLAFMIKAVVLTTLLPPKQSPTRA